MIYSTSENLADINTLSKMNMPDLYYDIGMLYGVDTIGVLTLQCSDNYCSMSPMPAYFLSRSRTSSKQIKSSSGTPHLQRPGLVEDNPPSIHVRSRAHYRCCRPEHKLFRS